MQSRETDASKPLSRGAGWRAVGAEGGLPFVARKRSPDCFTASWCSERVRASGYGADRDSFSRSLPFCEPRPTAELKAFPTAEIEPRSLCTNPCTRTRGGTVRLPFNTAPSSSPATGPLANAVSRRAATGLAIPMSEYADPPTARLRKPPCPRHSAAQSSWTSDLLCSAACPSAGRTSCAVIPRTMLMLGCTD